MTARQVYGRRKMRLGRSVVALVVAGSFATLAYSSTAGATIGCNAPNLVPIAQMPPQWRNFAPKLCIHRVKHTIYNPQDAVVAHAEGFWWCFAWAQKPSTPAGAILGWATATHFCRSRAWYYVQVIYPGS
jgi:hypothetical protein